MKGKILLTLLIVIAGTKFGYSQYYPRYERVVGCNNSEQSVYYYTKTMVYLYQFPSSESAIIKEIPKGKKVMVISSFSDYWDICYNGTTGYVHKSELSYKKVSSTRSKPNYSSNDNELNSNQDVGFDPFLGKTISSVNFRRGPSTNSSRIKTLSKGTSVYIYSDKSVNSYYKAIDIKTSQIGWIHKNYVKYIKNADINEKGAFQSTGYSSSYNSKISIRNKSSYTIKLIVGDEIFMLSPNSTRSVKVKPGKEYYIATAPGVIPSSGYQSFESNNGYEWEFWVETSRY